MSDNLEKILSKLASVDNIIDKAGLVSIIQRIYGAEKVPDWMIDKFLIGGLPDKAGLLAYAKKYYGRAMEIFNAAGMEWMVGHCYEKLGMYEEAYKTYLKYGNKEGAALCAEKLGMYWEAMDNYASLGRFANAHLCAEELGLEDLMAHYKTILDLAVECSSDLENKMVESIMGAIADAQFGQVKVTTIPLTDDSGKSGDDDSGSLPN